MSNDIGIAHRVTFNLVPIGIIEEIFDASLAVAWRAGDGLKIKDQLIVLERAVTKATQYTVPVDFKTGNLRVDEYKAMQGICSKCGGPSKKWTREEIKEAKDDMGMDDTDDFCDCCDECGKEFLTSP